LQTTFTEHSKYIYNLWVADGTHLVYIKTAPVT